MPWRRRAVHARWLQRLARRLHRSRCCVAACFNLHDTTGRRGGRRNSNGRNRRTGRWRGGRGRRGRRGRIGRRSTRRLRPGRSGTTRQWCRSAFGTRHGARHHRLMGCLHIDARPRTRRRRRRRRVQHGHRLGQRHRGQGASRQRRACMRTCGGAVAVVAPGHDRTRNGGGGVVRGRRKFQLQRADIRQRGLERLRRASLRLACLHALAQRHRLHRAHCGHRGLRVLNGQRHVYSSWIWRSWRRRRALRWCWSRCAPTA